MNLKLPTIAVAVLVLALGACAPKSSHNHTPSDEQVLFGEKVQSFVGLDSKNQVNEISVTLPYATLSKASAEPANVSLKLSEEVKGQTFFDHAMFFWAPQGIGPLAIPLFNFHFYGLSQNEVLKIDCSDLTQPNPANIPDGWLPPVPPGAPAKELCVPTMGFHAGPVGEDETQPFSKVMVTGFYAGKMNFIEPIFVKSLLDAKQNFELLVPKPKNLSRAILHPTKFSARYNSQTDSYTFALQEFVRLEAQ